MFRSRSLCPLSPRGTVPIVAWIHDVDGSEDVDRARGRIVLHESIADVPVGKYESSFG